MKKWILFTGALACSMGLLISFSSGPTSSLGDLTNSPFSNGSCGNCHNGGDFNPVLTVELLDGNDPVSEYIPEQTYRLRVTIEANNDPAGYGFQAVALQNADSTNAGMFSNPDADTKITPDQGRMYAEQNKRSSTNTFEVDWVAPAEGAGTVSFYASGNAVNGANGSGGDSPVQLAAPVSITEGESTSVRRLASVRAFSVFPNPVQNRINLRLENTDSRQLDLQIISTDGKSIHQQVWPVQAGENLLQYDASSLPAGHYILRLGDGSAADSRVFVKQ